MLGFIVIVVIGLLIVNYFRQTGAEPEITDRAAVQQVNQEKTHTVTSGESLWTIAEKYYGDGFAWTKIVEANNLANANDIEEGQVLVIPETTEVLAEASVSPTVTPAPTATPQPDLSADKAEVDQPLAETITADTYTVVHGDNLWDISVKVYGDGYRWTDIARANKLANPSVIHAGNVLTLPR